MSKRKYYVYHQNELIALFSESLLSENDMEDVAAIVQAHSFTPLTGVYEFNEFTKEVTV